MFLLFAPLATAQPRFFEPPEHFYKAHGSGLIVKWKLDRAELPEGESLTATLTILKATNPHEVVRPDLRKLPAFNDAFQIEDVPGPSAKPKDPEVTFAYRLKPRSRAVNRVPTLEFIYYNPALPEEKRFMSTRAAGQKITVMAVAPKARTLIPLDAPDALFEVVTGAQLLEREPFTPGTETWLLLLLGIAALALMWYIAWRRVYPDAARLTRIRRSRAARRATDAIRKAARTPDPAGAITAAVLGYLRARYPLPLGAETPSAIGDALRDAGQPNDDVIRFFRRCDEHRYSSSSDNALSLATDATAVVERLEATP